MRAGIERDRRRGAFGARDGDRPGIVRVRPRQRVIGSEVHRRRADGAVVGNRGRDRQRLRCGGRKGGQAHGQHGAGRSGGPHDKTDALPVTRHLILLRPQRPDASVKASRRRVRGAGH